MIANTTSHIDPIREAALRRAQKRVREMRAFYVSATAYTIIIPGLWIVNLVNGGKLWAHWATIGWGI